MSVNRNFPNYKKPVLTVKVISHEQGKNRAERRKDEAMERTAPQRNAQMLYEVRRQQDKDAHQEAIARRHAAAHARAVARRNSVARMQIA